jgi:Ca-activated chloride channel homolog
MSKYSSAQALLSLMFAFALTACAGGGPDAPAVPAAPAGTPSIQVFPGSYDFGKVTTTNTPAPLEITIINSGTAALKVSAISLAADSTFFLNTSAGSKPCGSAPTIAAADRCTFEVAFRPAGAGSYSSNLQISSDARNTPLVGLPISGASEPVSSHTVRINQVERSCPSNEATAYVSVTDQGGYPVRDLTRDHFSVIEGDVVRPIIASTYVEVAYQPLALSAVMDYSGSLTQQPVAFADMKNGFSTFVGGMRPQDIGQVIKFESTVEVVQPFTSDKAVLQAAIAAQFGANGFTKLYDAAFKAVDDTALNTTYRRAVLLATDGMDEGPTMPYSARTLEEVIANAKSKNVAIFTIGIGGSINRLVLEQIANETGGLFYAANTSQNLATIYQQLSTVLYERQYLLRFDQLTKPPGTAALLRIGTIPSTLGGNAVGTITSCSN